MTKTSDNSDKKSNPTPTPAKVRFHLTRSGWLFLLVTMLVGLAALKNQSALLYVLFGAMMAAAQLSAVVASNSLRYLELRRKAPGRVWQNQAVPMAYYVRNLKGRSCLGLTIEEIPSPRQKHQSKQYDGDGVLPLQAVGGYCASLPPHTVFRAGARFVATQRGRLSLDNVQVATDFPFGMVRATKRFADTENFQDIIVWPALGRLKYQLLPHGAVELSSSAPSRSTGGQDEFAGLREYRQDDNPRWIHWRRSATALTMNGQPVVREMARPRPEILWIVLDTRLETALTAKFVKGVPNDPKQRLELVLRFAATLIEHALLRGYQVGLATAHSSGPIIMPAAAGAADRTAMLDSLATVDNNTSVTLADIVKSLNPGNLRQAQTILVSPDLAIRQNQAAALARLHSLSRNLTVFSADKIGDIFEDVTPATVQDIQPMTADETASMAPAIQEAE